MKAQNDSEYIVADMVLQTPGVSIRDSYTGYIDYVVALQQYTKVANVGSRK